MLLDSLRVTELTMCAIILETGGRALDEVDLVGDQFDSIPLGRIYDTMAGIHAAGKPIDLAGLLQQLSPDDGVILASDISNIVGYRDLADHHAEIITKHALHRDLKALGQGLQELSPDLTSEEMVEYARKRLDAAEGVKKTPLLSMPELWSTALARVTNHEPYFPTPWPSLNDAMGGLKAGALHVFAARPGIGKTVVALQMATKLGQEGVVAFSSLEMTKEELTLRAIASAAGVNVSHLTRNRLDDRSWDAISRARPEFVSEIYIDDRAAVGPSQIRRHVREVARKGRLSGIVIDYLQLMTVPGPEKRQEKVAEFSRQLKILAKEFQVPVIALSQLNRNSENRMDKKPALSDLRESGAIEQDADVVVLLSREEETATFFMDVAKNRNAPPSVVELIWRGEISQVRDYRGNI